MSKAPTVSIVLPTYNRAKFLPEALASIRGQEFTDWELIVVDDGSTDATEAVVRSLSQDVPQSVRYVRQENQGPYAARNAGIDLAEGSYIAFFDSDDLWLPHHLQNCVDALEANPDVAWAYGACRIVDHASGDVVADSTFYVGDKPLSFFKATSRTSGRLQVLDDRAAVKAMVGEERLKCGLQNSVIRRSVFEGLRLPPFRIGEDRAFTVLALLNGARIGFLDDVHVVYRVHDGNVSLSTDQQDVQRKIAAVSELIGAYEFLNRAVAHDRALSRGLRRTLSREYFWQLGYLSLWQSGHRQSALRAFRRALRLWPWDWKYWKTYAACSGRQLYATARAALGGTRTSDEHAADSECIDWRALRCGPKG